MAIDRREFLKGAAMGALIITLPPPGNLPVIVADYETPVGTGEIVARLLLDGKVIDEPWNAPRTVPVDIYSWHRPGDPRDNQGFRSIAKDTLVYEELPPGHEINGIGYSMPSLGSAIVARAEFPCRVTTNGGDMSVTDIEFRMA